MIYHNKSILKIIFVFLLFAILTVSSLSEGMEKKEQVLAIKNAHIYPVTDKKKSHRVYCWLRTKRLLP